MWAIGKQEIVRKSRFLGRAIRVKSLEESRLALRHLKLDKSLKNATHNISATRVQVGSSSILEEANDNGEPPAASRIVQLMRSENMINALVVVTRWYGGQKLGSDRFRVIDSAAKSAMDALLLEEKGVQQTKK